MKGYTLCTSVRFRLSLILPSACIHIVSLRAPKCRKIHINGQIDGMDMRNEEHTHGQCEQLTEYALLSMLKAATINVQMKNEVKSAIRLHYKLTQNLACTHNGGGNDSISSSNDSGGWYRQTPAAAPEYVKIQKNVRMHAFAFTILLND